MGKVAIQEVARILIEKGGLKPREAEMFAATMFDIIQEALDRDRQVKIKGLGTFKIIGVEARESINVNTGERVVIGSHGKISFTPDATMKELVNKPFSQFETVVLNDGVEFDDLTDEPAEEQEEAEKPMEADELTEQPAAGTADEESPAFGEEEKAEAAQPAIAPVLTPVVAETPEQEEALPQEMEAAVLQEAEGPVSQETETAISQETEAPAPQDEPATNIEPSQPTLEPLVANDAEANDAEGGNGSGDGFDDDDNDGEGRPSNWWKWLVFGLISLVLIAGAAYGGYRYGYQAAVDDLAAAGAETDSSAVAEEKIDTVVTVDSLDIEELPVEEVEEAPVREEPSVAQPAPQQPEPVAAEPAKPAAEPLDKYAAMDNRVRTGAYRIIGTDRTVTVKPGETLYRISRRELGEGMECYIEVYNGITESTELKAGQVLKIPKLEWKKKRKTQ
ncbi:MAG: HU family DNA-binding protein [Prevotella sp.]|nr:HU family DNA-binding protein [Prevotella sp.]